MAGNKNSGRKKGAKNKKKKSIFNLNKNKSELKTEKKEKTQVVENTAELKSVENDLNLNASDYVPEKMTEKNDNFDEVGLSIAAQSAAALAEEKNKINAPDPTPAGSPAAAPESQPASDLPQEEGWKDVAALGYLLAGEFVETKTGMKELNYTEQEIEFLSEHTEKVIKVLWPNATGGLTEDQKILLFSGSMIFKVHLQKYNFYLKAKEMELEKMRLQSESRNSDNKTPA